MHGRLVAARLHLAEGRRTSADSPHIRRGLDDLAAFQARFGSQDLAGRISWCYGRELTQLGPVYGSLETRSPAPPSCSGWKRSRGASTRLAAVRPSALDGSWPVELSARVPRCTCPLRATRSGNVEPRGWNAR